MAESAGPFGPDIRYRRTGCADEFWFTTLDGAVVFQVEHAAPGGALAVRASVADAALVAAGGRVRVISRRSALAAERAGADAKLAEILGAGSRRVAGPVTAR
jgi:hypothetical protein